MKRLFALVLAALATAAVCAEGPVNRQTPVWSQHLAGRISSVNAFNESILLGGENGLYTMSYSKAVLWFYPTSAAVTSTRRLGGGRILATGADGSLILLDSGGKMIWERAVPGYVGYDEAIDAGGDLIVCGSMDGYVYVLDMDGTYLWKHLVGSYVMKVFLLEDTIVAISDREVYIFDLDGRVRRNLAITDYVRSATVVRDGIAVGMSDGRLYSYGMDGQVAWSSTIGDYISAVVGDGNITVGTREGRILRFTGNGTLLWDRNMSAPVVALKSTDHETVVGTKDNRVSVFDPEGSMRWYIEADGRPSAISAAGETLVVGTTAGTVYFAKTPQRDSVSNAIFLSAAAVILFAAIVLVSRSWR